MVGHILEARGYDAAYSLVDKGSANLQPGNPLTDLIISEDKIELRYGNIDIGGYGKGWLIDRLAEQLKDQFGLEQFLINGGGDIYATHENNRSVDILLEDPQNPGTIIGNTKIKNQGFAASSPHKRAWPKSPRSDLGDFENSNHIVSNQKVKDVIYLIADSAVEADVFATTLLQVDDETTQDLVDANCLTIL